MSAARVCGWLAGKGGERGCERGRGGRLFEQAAAKRIPLQRLGDPEEFAAMAVFLASERSSYITGVAVNINGGSSPSL